ncbi:DUF6035 family protein [Pseudoalteromonas sp. Of7M-16]|uniref:DUF6035 family protein n=1 Tax=Pseudoalteromonas sp. Of7M-16 TaxID=2917756 RepID=UPI001EF40E04|nr:DUF6035 family protein [Pseudoalteromonas sp. Of7M-16]MCG7551647.1 DUF6035 family protein [Pseudoalteromonas sp. Of7M-16]
MEKRHQIPIVIDTWEEESLWVDSFDFIYEQAELQGFRTNKKFTNRFACQNCKNPVFLKALADESRLHGHHYYFSHHKDAVCPWKSDSTTVAEIYAGVEEGRLHLETKRSLANTLKQLEHWQIIDIDKKFIFSADKLNRAKPDLHAQYKGKDVVFEVQLRSESPKVVMKRQEFYKNKGFQLIWLSATKDNIFVDEDKGFVKQVHKDIAFCNRGNWFIFDAIQAEKSVKKGQLQLIAMVWESYLKLDSKRIKYDWNEYKIDYAQLTYEDGETFYKDFFAINKAHKDRLRDLGRKTLQENIREYRVHNWNEFLKAAKSEWPSLEVDHERKWLKALFKIDYESRELEVKRKVLEVVRHYSNQGEQFYQRWSELENKLAKVDSFGVSRNMNLQVVEKVLLILGYDLTSHLNTKNKSHCRAVHNFFDYGSFIPYQSLCLKAIELSPLKDEILADENVLKRLHMPLKIDCEEENKSIHGFLGWFASEPRLKDVELVYEQVEA